MNSFGNGLDALLAWIRSKKSSRMRNIFYRRRLRHRMAAHKLDIAQLIFRHQFDIFLPFGCAMRDLMLRIESIIQLMRFADVWSRSAISLTRQHKNKITIAMTHRMSWPLDSFIHSYMGPTNGDLILWQFFPTKFVVFFMNEVPTGPSVFSSSSITYFDSKKYFIFSFTHITQSKWASQSVSLSRINIRFVFNEDCIVAQIIIVRILHMCIKTTGCIHKEGQKGS